VLVEFDQLNDALLVAIWIIASYILVWHILGVTTIMGALSLKPNEPELAARHITNSANAAFLTVSHFANGGFSLSSGSVVYLQDNPLAYMLLCMLIPAGNTMVAIYLRICVVAVTAVRRRLGLDVKAYQYILDHPRRITTHIFSHEQTVFLFWMTLGLIVLQYIFYLGSCLQR
jgi:Trk-type K+ transport system membrane component